MEQIAEILKDHP
jgi:kynurenine aminotransferase